MILHLMKHMRVVIEGVAIEREKCRVRWTIVHLGSFRHIVNNLMILAARQYKRVGILAQECVN
jgi:hypothetical protein